MSFQSGFDYRPGLDREVEESRLIGEKRGLVLRVWLDSVDQELNLART